MTSRILETNKGQYLEQNLKSYFALNLKSPKIFGKLLKDFKVKDI